MCFSPGDAAYFDCIFFYGCLVGDKFSIIENFFEDFPNDILNSANAMILMAKAINKNRNIYIKEF